MTLRSQGVTKAGSSGYLEARGRARRTVEMTTGIGMAGGAGIPQPDRVAALLADAQRVLAEVERLLLGAQQAGVEVTARQLAAQQAAIVAAAHEEAAAVLAAAQVDAARIRNHAAAPHSGAPAQPSDLGGVSHPSVIDLRDPAAQVSAVMAPPPRVQVPSARPAATPAASSVVLGADVRATLSAAAEMARRVSSRIERLSRDLSETRAQ